MVDYTKEEGILVAKCIGYYRRQMLPDDDIDKNDPQFVLAAIDYCHSIGQFIRNIKSHNLMYSIMEKNGEKVESNAVRQVRLAKERKQAVIDAKIGRLESEELAKKQELAKATAKKEAAKTEVKTLELREISISDKEVRAKLAQEKAEAIAKEQADEIARLKAELANKTDTNYLVEAMEELNKGEEAKLTVEPPKTVEVKEPPAEIKAPIGEPIPVKKEKTVEELIEDLK